MEAYAAPTPTSMLTDLEHLLDYFLGSRFAGVIFAKKIRVCAKKMEKFIDLLSLVANSSSSCKEIYMDDLKIIWNFLKKIKSASTNFTVPLTGDYHSQLIVEFDAILFLRTKFKYKSIGCLHIPPNNDPDLYSSVINEYVDIGKHLSQSPVIENIRKELQTLRNDCLKPSSYAAIIGPSYAGKTQTAFTLSHCMNVFYINFLSSSNLECRSQRIYSEFDTISGLFSEVVSKDMDHNMTHSTEHQSATYLIRNRHYKYLSLGLILILSRWKKFLGSNCPPETWFHLYKQIGQVHIPRISIDDFRICCREYGIDLNNSLVFIDELPLNEPSISGQIRFIRNLFRTVNITVALSGTNSHVNNLVGKLDSKMSRTDSLFPWVKIISVLPHADLNTLGCSIQFKTFGIGTRRKLSDFIENEFIQYDRLLPELIGFSANTTIDTKKKDDSVKIIEFLNFFLAEQAPTSLPGLSVEALQFIFSNLSCYDNSSFDLKKLWSQTVHYVTNVLMKRKPSVAKSFGLMASAHILTFPTNFKLKYQSMDGCARAVNKHFYYYGRRGQNLFDLYRKFDTDDEYEEPIDETNIKFSLDMDGTIPFHDPVYFPFLKEDFFLTITCLNVWFVKSKFTVASLYQKYLDDWYKFKIDSAAKVPNSFAFELLAHWCICYSGHLDVCGKTDGWEGIELFLKNMQVVQVQIENLSQFKVIVPPASLTTFLKVNEITIPYLFPRANHRSTIVRRVSDFIEMGDSYRPSNAIGCDVIFHVKMNSVMKKCFIECKLWTVSVGLPIIIKYYKKACLKKHPISILVSRSFQKSLQSPNVLEGKAALPKNELLNLEGKVVLEPNNEGDFKEISDPNDEDYSPSDSEDDDGDGKEKAEPYTEVQEEKGKKKKAKVTIDYVAEFNKLWEDGRNPINLYTVKFDPATLSFTWTELKVFPNPIGVFIISNSNFSPPEISSRN